MRDVVTKQRRLSLAGCKPRISPVIELPWISVSTVASISLSFLQLQVGIGFIDSHHLSIKLTSVLLHDITELPWISVCTIASISLQWSLLQKEVGISFIIWYNRTALNQCLCSSLHFITVIIAPVACLLCLLVCPQSASSPDSPIIASYYIPRGTQTQTTH